MYYCTLFVAVIIDGIDDMLFFLSTSWALTKLFSRKGASCRGKRAFELFLLNLRMLLMMR